MEILRRGQNAWLTLSGVFFVLFGTLSGVAIAANGRFQFAQAVYSTTEDFGVAYITVQRSLGFNGRAAVYVSSIPGMGNAVAGRDFKPIFNVSLVWQDGEDVEKELYVPIYNDGKPQEVAKTFTLKLHDAVGAEINLYRNQTQIILVPPSNLLPGSFTFEKEAVSITEGNSLTIPVLWVAGTTSTASVKFEVVCKSACSPDDFVVVSPTTKLLEWKRDDYPVNSISRTQNIVLQVIGDKLHEQAESFSLRLLAVEAEEGDPIGTALIGNIGEAVITIAGPNDVQSGTLQFDAECFPDCASTKYSVTAGGTAVVLVQRRRGSDGDCSVTVATHAGTALSGLDYEPLEQTIFWKEGDASDKQILVRTVSRPDPRLPTRRVTLVLKNNKGAQINGVHSSTTYVDIASLTGVFLGDVNFAVRDPLESVLKPPELGLITLASRNTSSRLQLCPSVVATESGVLSVAIQRNFADFLVPVRVVVTTVAGTATPSVDYEPLDTVINWVNDDAEVKHVLVHILTPPTFDPRPRSFWLQLSDVTGAIVGDCNLLEVVLTGIASGPHLSSFELNMALGTLTLQMSASVQASTLDVSKLLLQSERELKNGPIFKFSPQQTTTSSLDGATIVLNIGAGDLNALKRVVGLARSDSTTFLSVGNGLFQYILNNCQSSGILACSPAKTIATSALAVSKFTADTIAPTLVGFSLDLPRRLLKLHFSEAVDFAGLMIEALSFSETAGGVDVYRLSSSTTRLFSPQPDPLSGATLRDLNRLPADYTFLTLQLGRPDITSLASFGTGKIGISRANTFLGIGSAFVKDFAGNPVLAVSSPAFRQVSAADCSACPTGTYLISSCSDLKDRKCATCSVCPGNSYALEACRSTQDTLCYPCTECRSGQYVSVACSPTTDRVCAPCTQCTLDEYEVSTCAAGADRICRTCNSCALTTAQQWLCQRSPMWKRLQMRLPFSCPQPGQLFKTREEQLQRAKSNKCGSGRCSCVATSIAGNANPNGDGFPVDSRCTGPVAYNILV